MTIQSEKSKQPVEAHNGYPSRPGDFALKIQIVNYKLNYIQNWLFCVVAGSMLMCDSQTRTIAGLKNDRFLYFALLSNSKRKKLIFGGFMKATNERLHLSRGAKLG